MEKFTFFELAFEQYNPTVSKKYIANRKEENNKIIDPSTTLADEFHKFFNVNNFHPLFTNESRTSSIVVSWAQASELIKTGSRPHKLLKDFANWLNTASDNKSYERAVFKILHESRTWQGFLKQIQDHIDYLPYIEEGYKHNTWNIVFYDKDKSGTKVSRGI